MGCYATSLVELRGAGVPVSACPGGERDGLLCYPKCAAGYYGVGPLCWQVRGLCALGVCRGPGMACGATKATGAVRFLVH